MMLTRPHGRAAIVLVAAALTCSNAFALFSGQELGLRDFPIGDEYFLDIAPYEYSLRIREIWGASALEAGGPRGYLFSYGSTTGDEALVQQDMELRFGLDDPWSFRFRLFEGEAPDGRFRHIWTGLEIASAGGWRWYLFGEPTGAKEQTDMGVSMGRESLSDAGGLRNRWEVRAILVDIPFDDTNDRNALKEDTQLDLQASSMWALGERGWVWFELDLGLPFSLNFGANAAAPPEEQNFVFDYEKVSGSLAAKLRSARGDVLWLEFRGETSERGRTYFGLGPTSEDFAVDYDLSRFRAEWWRGVTDDLQLSLGYEFVVFDEDVVFPNDTPRNELQDRTDHILSAQLRRRFGDDFFLTTGLWIDILDREVMAPGVPLRTEGGHESNFGIIFEFPTNFGEVRGGHFLLGATIDLDRGFSAHGFGQLGVTF
jgi:hypothetical protein